MVDCGIMADVLVSHLGIEYYISTQAGGSHTHPAADLDYLQIRHLNAEQALTVGEHSLDMSPITVSAGKTYAYALRLFAVSPGTAGTLGAGAFAAGSGAAVSMHRRAQMRLNSNTYGSTCTESADLTTYNTSFTVIAGSGHLWLVEGVLTCSAAGTLVPKVVVANNPVTIRTGSHIIVREIGRLAT